MRRVTGLIVLLTALSALDPALATDCPLVPDPVGDVASTAPYDPALDLVSGDLVSDATTLTAAIRVAGSPTSATGAGTYVSVVRSGDALLQLTVQHGATGVSFSASAIASGELTSESVEVPARGTVDDASGEIRVSISLADLPAFFPAAPGTLFTGVGPLSAWQPATVTLPIPQPMIYAGNVVDDTERRTYVAGSPACITP